MSTENNYMPCDCRDLLQQVIDGQATDAQAEEFRNHLSQCPSCKAGYEVDSAVREMLKTRCCPGPVPEDLVDRIREHLRKEA